MLTLRREIKDLFSPSTKMADFSAQPKQQQPIRSALKAKAGPTSTDPRLAMKPLPIISNNNQNYSKAGRAPGPSTNGNNAGPSNLNSYNYSKANDPSAPTDPSTQLPPDPAREHAEGLLKLAQEAQTSYAGILSDALSALTPGTPALSRGDLLEILSLLGGTLHAVEQGVTNIETKSENGEITVPESARPYLQATMVIVQGILLDVSERCQEYAKNLNKRKRSTRTRTLSGKDVMSAFVGVTIVVLESFTKLSTDCLRRLQ